VQFVYSDLGIRKAGDIVECTLSGTEANVALLDSSNYSAFKSGRKWRGVGGLAKRSPVHLTVPRGGRWYAVAYITPGYRGSVRAGFRVLPRSLPTLRQSTPSPLAAIRDAAEEYAGLAEPDENIKQYDVFVSHASEDKDEVVRPLAEALQALNVSVWFDEQVLRIGDSLRRKIDAGLATCRFGVVVLSPAFFKKGWPNYELDGLVTREVAGTRQLILPVWHNVSKQEVMKYSPSLADKLARSTSDTTIEQLAEEIADVVNPDEEVA
jgi:hypothetical protein